MLVYYGTWREPAPVVQVVHDDAFDGKTNSIHNITIFTNHYL